MQPDLQNQTDFLVEPHTLVDRDGECLVAIVKATFELVPGPPRGADGSFACAPPARRRKIRAADVPWGEPEKSSILHPSDLCVRKPSTDVLVVARAHAPAGEPTPTFDAGVKLGKVQKVVRITGPRVFAGSGDTVTRPRPVRTLDVRYDFAFGGSEQGEEEFVEDIRNPVGIGVAVDPRSLDGSPAPQIEDPLDPVVDARSRPKPAGLGAIGRHWEARRALWGTYDAAWLERRAPLPPEDFDDRANQAATPELIHSPPLRGGEEGALTNLVEGHPSLGLVLPKVSLRITFKVKGREPVVVEPPIDTVLLDSRVLPFAEDEAGKPIGEPLTPLVLELVWRASVPSPRRPTDATIVVEEVRA
jgi:hypothetical protein